jgi:hypothetical protein
LPKTKYHATVSDHPKEHAMHWKTPVGATLLCVAVALAFLSWNVAYAPNGGSVGVSFRILGIWILFVPAVVGGIWLLVAGRKDARRRSGHSDG